MKVKFKTRSSGPEGTIYPGQVVDVPESEARMLAEGGYAVLLEQPRTAEAEQMPAEMEQSTEEAEQMPEETEQPAEKTEPKADNRQKPERKRG